MKRAFRPISERTAPPVVAYLVAFVASFTLQRTQVKLIKLGWCIHAKSNTNKPGKWQQMRWLRSYLRSSGTTVSLKTEKNMSESRQQNTGVFVSYMLIWLPWKPFQKKILRRWVPFFSQLTQTNLYMEQFFNGTNTKKVWSWSVTLTAILSWVLMLLFISISFWFLKPSSRFLLNEEINSNLNAPTFIPL